MSNPLISVVLPAFNAQAVLRDALESIRQQEYRNFEAIVVDDGSEDATAAVARSYVASDSRFVLLQQPHRGVAAARNAGLAAARGDWIAFIDADDVWFANKLARQIDCLQHSPGTDFIFSNYYFWDGQNDLRLRYSSDKKFGMDDLSLRLTRHNLVGVSTVCVRRDVMTRAGGFDPELEPAEDWDMWLRIAEGPWSPLRLAEPLARYRVWSGNASRQKMRMAQAEVAVLRKRLASCGSEILCRSYRRSLTTAERNRARLASPWRPRWVLWSIASRCPWFLGGDRLRQSIHRQIKAR